MEIKLVTTEIQLIQILELQQVNHFENVTDQVKGSEGFVTVRHTLDLLKKMNESTPQIIAVDKGRVVAYALAMLKEFKDLIPILIPMYSSFDQLSYRDTMLTDLSYYVMGQICIDKNYRGKSVFGCLYQKHKEVYSNKFDLCMTEVSTSNPRSMRAHMKTGFKILKTYEDETDEWNILSWDWGNSSSR